MWKTESFVLLEARDLRLQLADRRYRTVDWDGAFVLPGLVDAHMHLGMHGLKLGMLDFTEATSKEEMLAMLRERVAVTTWRVDHGVELE